MALDEKKDYIAGPVPETEVLSQSSTDKKELVRWSMSLVSWRVHTDWNCDVTVLD